MSNWLYYRPLTIDYTKIDSSLTDYPVMVKLDATNFSFSRVRSDGYDLIFTSSDGLTVYKHEIELFDSINEKAVYHVKIPSVSDTVDTTFRMYYGDSSVTTDQSDKTNVWDSNFVMVQHMGDSLVDSTGNGNDGTNYGSAVVDGLNGKARSFDGTIYSYISIPTTEEMFDYNPNEVEFQAIYKPTNLSVTYLFETRNSSEDWAFSFRHESTSEIRFYINTATRDDLITLHSTPTTAYSNICLNWSKGNDANININGNLEASSTTSGTSLLNLISGINIGSDRSYERRFAGIIDEFRISSIARSDAWIKADDYNLRTNTLISVGAEDTPKTVTGIELIQEPTKKDYLLGENLNLTGALIEITYDDATTAQIQPSSTSGFDSSVESFSQEVTVSFAGFSDSFFVSISHDKAAGDYLAIEFTEKLNPPTLIDGASLGYRPEGFIVSGYEYDWTYGPDYNGALTLKTYPVSRVMKHPLYDDEYHLRLIMTDSFKNVQGLISISYDQTLGDLAGSGGAVESFTESFTPTELVPIFNPNAPDHLTITSDFALAVKEVEYESYKLDEPADQIGIFPSSMSITVIHVGTLPL